LQALYYLSHAPVLLLLVYFSGKISHFCLNWPRAMIVLPLPPE
jgi:hypothetical protein